MECLVQISNSCIKGMFYTLVIVIKDFKEKREGKMERGKYHSRMKLLLELRGVFQRRKKKVYGFFALFQKKKGIKRIKKEEGS